MTITFRQAGYNVPLETIENVTYVEPLPGIIQYTTDDGDEVETIVITEQGDFVYKGKAWDFCQIYS